MGLWSNHRPLFTDGWNSCWHVFFGMMAVWYWWITPIFIAYQLKDYKDKNLWVDLAEFFFGWIVIFILIHIGNDCIMNDCIGNDCTAYSNDIPL